MSSARVPGNGPCDGSSNVDEKEMKLPGATATSIKVPAFLNSLPRLMLKTKGSLQGFLLSLVSSRGPANGSTSLPSSTTWPMPIPYPEVFSKKALDRVVDSHWKRLISLQVVVLSWLALGCPSRAPGDLCLGRKLSAAQWSVVRMLEHLSSDGNTPEFVEAQDMGRAAGKVEDMEFHLAALARAVTSVQSYEKSYFAAGLSKPAFEELPHLRSGRLIGKSDKAAVISARPVVASRLTFPDPPSFDPRPFFDQSTYERFVYPRKMGLSDEEVGEDPPRVSVRADSNNKVELYKKLAETRRLQPLVPGSFSRRFTSGLFSVPKDMSRDRLILDGRPANMKDRPQSKWCKAMAAASTLAQLHIEDDKVLVCSGEDLRDFFYQFQVNEERTARNVLADPITKAEASYIFGSISDDYVEDGLVWVGLSTLAMGDTCSVEYAQCSHLSLCLKSKVAFPEELVMLKTAIPRGLLQVGIIIDDLVVLEQILRAPIDGRQDREGPKRIERAKKAYAAVSLQDNPKKAFTEQTMTRFWGVEIDGSKGIMRGSSLRLWPITVISVRVCLLGLATVGLIEALAGAWVSLLGVRRKLFSMMDIIFEPLSIPDQKAVIRLSPELVSEMMSLAVVGTLACVNLRARHSDFIAASDASLHWMAAVRAKAPATFVKELSRHCVRKGMWSKLLTPWAAHLRASSALDPDDEVPDGEEPYVVNPLWELVARGLPYEECWRCEVKKPQHINVLELRSHLREERRISSSHKSVRIPYGIDSQVCLGTVSKGRSASRALNVEMRKSVPWAIGSDLYGDYMYFPSYCNRADGPTRHSKPAPPDVKLPGWWKDACDGKFAGLDRWLRDHGAPDVGSEVPLEDIGAFSSSDIAPANRGSKKKRKKKIQTMVDRPVPDDQVQIEEGVFSKEAEVILKSFSSKQFFFAKDGDRVIRSKGCLDLYSGKFGVARSLISQGAPWVLTFEILRSAEENLLDNELQEKLFFLVQEGVFGAAMMAPVCSSHSVAITPPVRSRRYPRGIPGMRHSMREKVRIGNQHADLCRALFGLFDKHGVYYIIENPDGSFMWAQRGWEKFRSPSSPDVFRACFCRFGTGWKKPTKFGTNTILAAKTMWCQCGKRSHIQLRGMHPTRRIPMTLVAQPYPSGLSKLLAAALCQSYGWASKRKLNISACCRCNTMRIGEAKNPGPARGTLEEVDVISFGTQQMEARLLNEFLHWAASHLRSTDVADLFSRVPLFLVQSLRCYGDLLYQKGGALSNLRHLILACQKWLPMSRPLMGSAWDLVARWEQICPVKHRQPVPEALVKAVCVFGWHQQWYSFVGATLLAFYGAGRLGEVLRTTREDLVLPCDVLEPSGAAVFLRLRQFKSLRRQPAKVQHMKVVDRTASLLLQRIFGRLPYFAPLFGASAYQYRKRWDLAIEAFCRGSTPTLTPGGLRAGSAVYHYKMGKPIADLMWLMRLRSQTTVESYLQEVAALNVLATMPSDCRNAILAAASTFPYLIAGCLSGRGSS